MKKNHIFILISCICAVVLVIIVSITLSVSIYDKSDSNIDIDTNIVEVSSSAHVSEASQVEGVSGITSETNDVLTAEQSQNIVDMALYFTAFQPETDGDKIVFSRSNILNYLSVFYDNYPSDSEKERAHTEIGLSFSQLDNDAKAIFGSSIPASDNSPDTTGWDIISGKYYPSPELIGLGTARLVSIETDTDRYFAQVDIANCLWQRSMVYRLRITVEPNPDSPTGFKFNNITYETRLSKSIESVEASSEKPASGDVNYMAGNLIDGKLSTFWCENAVGSGILEWIKLTPAENTTFSAIGIVNGYISSYDEYYNNGRIKNILIQFPGGYSINETVSDDCFNNNGSPYIVLLGSDIQASWVKITIESVYEGKTYSDTYISEIRLY